MSTQPKSNSNPFYSLISILSLIGAAISIWQTRLYHITRSGMSDFHSFCNIGQTFDCTAIEMSKFSELYSGFPLSAFALAGYLVIFTISLFIFGDDLKKNVRTFLLPLTGIAFLFSISYLVIMIAVIGKLCLFCLFVDAINLLMLIFAFKLPKPDLHESTANSTRFIHVFGVGVFSLGAAMLANLALNPQADVKKEDMNDIIESILSSPAVPIEIPADAPVIGNPNAPITVVKFSDYECPACRMGATAIHPLFKRYPTQVKFVFMHFPLAQECNSDPQLKRTMHEFACEAATVAVCSAEQGKFNETYETLFEFQKDFSQGKIAELLTSKVSGIDLGKLKSCMALPSTLEKIKNDAKVGINLKVQSTPTFFMNGKKIEGGLPTSIWIELIDRMLAKSN